MPNPTPQHINTSTPEYTPMALKIGITGGIGSGKSVVCEIFALLGVPVFNSDLEGRSILETDAKVVAAVKEIFGAEAYTEDGKPDRDQDRSNGDGHRHVR